MSITLDHVTGSQGLTFNHTVGSATHSYLLVQANLAGSSASVTSVTYGAAPLARLVRDTTGNTIELWGLADPVAGTATVTITLSAGAGNSCAAMSFFGAAPLEISATGHAAGSSNTASLTITGQTADVIVCGLVSGAGTPTGGETSLWNDGSGDAACSIPATAGPQSVSYSLGSVMAWAVAAVSLHEDPPVVVVNNTLNLTAIRAAIVQTIAGIPEIQRVDDTTYKGEANNNMPFAQVLRGPVQMHSLTLTGEEADVQLGAYDYLVPWTIRVYCAPASLPDMQTWDDLMVMRLQEAFNSNRLLQPNGAGVVDNSRIDLIEGYLQEESRPALWVTEASLKTFIVASL